MDFDLFVNDQSSKFVKSNYFDYLYSCLNENATSADFDEEEKERFKENVPINMNSFFNDCISKVQEMLEEKSTLEWENVDQKYLCVMTYWALTNTEHSFLMAISAARLYLSLNCLPKTDGFNMSHNGIFELILNVVESHLTTTNALLHIHSLLDTMKTYLQNLQLPRDLMRPTVHTLYEVTQMDPQVPLHEYLMEQPTVNAQHAAFVCIKAILEALCSDVDINKRDILFICVKLLSSLNSSKITMHTASSHTVYLQNMEYFMKSAMPGNILLLAIKAIIASPQYDNYCYMIKFLEATGSHSLCSELCWFVVEGLVCDKKEYRRHLPKLMKEIVVNYRHPVNDKKATILELGMLNMIKLCGDANPEIAESALTNLEEILSSNDRIVDTVTQIVIRLAHNKGNGSRKPIVALERHIDVTWKKKAINKSFINVICMLSKYDTTPQQLEGVDAVCDLLEEVHPPDVRPCINNLLTLLQRLESNRAAFISILSFFVKTILSPLPVSNFCAEALTGILFPFRSQQASLIANTLISPMFDYSAVFKKFFTLNLIRKPHLQQLINEELPRDYKVLNIISVLLDFVDYSKFDYLMEHTSTIFEAGDFEDGNVLFYALHKILTRRNKNSWDSMELEFIKTLDRTLVDYFRNEAIQLICVSNATVLLMELRKHIPGEVPLKQLLSDLEANAVEQLVPVVQKQEVSSFYAGRSLAYLVDLAILSETKIKIIYLLLQILQPDDLSNADYLERHPEAWCTLINAVTKLSILNDSISSQQITDILVKAISSDIEEVKQYALYALEDYCRMHLRCFDLLIPWLFKFIQCNLTSISMLCIPIIDRLVCDDYLILDEEQYIVLTALFGIPHLCIRLYVTNLLSKNFLLKSQKAIESYFVPSIPHYGVYNRHNIISDPGVDITPTPEGTHLSSDDRKHIYQHLLKALPQNIQFCIIDELNQKILEQIVRGHLTNRDELLIDSLNILDIFVCELRDEENITLDDKKVCKSIDSLISGKITFNTASKFSAYLIIIKKLMTVLLKLLYKIHIVSVTLRGNVMRTALILTDLFLHEISICIKDGNTGLLNLYKEFHGHYEQFKDEIWQDLAPINVEEHQAHDSRSPGSSFMSKVSTQTQFKI